jgi:hypothetical protein
MLFEGNLVSEFGFGSRKEAAMALVDSFEPTYWFTQIRVAGDELRLLRAYPGKWQVRRFLAEVDVFMFESACDMRESKLTGHTVHLLSK